MAGPYTQGGHEASVAIMHRPDKVKKDFLQQGDYKPRLAVGVGRDRYASPAQMERYMKDPVAAARYLSNGGSAKYDKDPVSRARYLCRGSSCTDY